MVSKIVYKDLRNRTITPAAQLHFNTLFINDDLEWKEIYSLPLRISLKQNRENLILNYLSPGQTVMIVNDS